MLNRLTAIIRTSRCLWVHALSKVPVWFGVAVVGSIVQGLLAGLLLLAMQHGIDAVASQRPAEGLRVFEEVLYAFLLYGVVRAGTLLTEFATEAAKTHIMTATDIQVRTLLVESGAAVPLTHFEDEHLRDAMERAYDSAQWRAPVLMMLWVDMARDAVRVLSLLGYLFVVSPLLGVLGIASALPVLVAGVQQGAALKRLFEEQTGRRRRTGYLFDLLTGATSAKEIRTFDAGPFLLDRWFSAKEQLYKAEIQVATVSAARSLALRVPSVACYFGAAWLALRLAAVHHLSTGAIVGALYGFFSVASAMREILVKGVGIHEQALYVADLFGLESAVSGAPVQAWCSGVSVELDNVSYRYPDGKDALLGVTATAGAGRCIAIVGENGAGKSTLAKLLLGLYTPSAGTMTFRDLGGRPLNGPPRRSAVFQDHYRFQLAVREVVGFGDVDAPQKDERVLDAFRRAGTEPVLQALDRGLETEVGNYFESGRDLSGGQWQALAITRGVFREANLLVMDEPSASLDPRAEDRLVRQFRSTAEGATAFVIAHRLPLARIADEIWVMKEGRVVEVGTHQDLIDRGGEYAALFVRQMRAYQDWPAEASDAG